MPLSTSTAAEVHVTSALAPAPTSVVTAFLAHLLFSQNVLITFSSVATLLSSAQDPGTVVTRTDSPESAWCHLNTVSSLRENVRSMLVDTSGADKKSSPFRTRECLPGC